MGKYSKKDRRRDRADPLSGRPAKVLDPATAALRDQKILPAVAALRGDTKSKTVAATTIANLIEDEKCRKLFLREGLVRILMEDTINDSDLDVACKGWGILRNLALAEQPDFCVHLYRQDILTPLGASLHKLLDVTRRPDRPGKAEQALMITMTTSLASLLSSLALATEELMDIVASQPGLVGIMMSLLSALPGAISCEEAILYLFYDVTEASQAFCGKLVRVPTVLQRIDRYRDTEDVRAALACGILSHIGPEMSEARMDNPRAQILETLHQLLVKYAALQQTAGINNGNMPEASDPRPPLERTLDVIATIASDIEDEEDAHGAHGKNEEEDFEGLGDESADDDETMEGDATLDEAPVPNGPAVTNGRSQDPDIDMADGMSASLHDSETSRSLHSLQYILQQLAPTIIDLAKPPSNNNRDTFTIHLKALYALNNISWATYSVMPTFPFPAHIPNLLSLTIVLELWEPLAQRIWTNIISPILASPTTSPSLTTQTTTLAAAVANSVNGNLTLSEPYEYRKFMSLYQADLSHSNHAADAHSDYSLAQPCISVLAAFALSPNVDVNRETGTFLLELLFALPATPVPHAVQALDALFHTYADAAFPYDQPIFVQGGFLEKLRGVLPKVKKMAKSVDRRVDAEGRARADEAVFELGRFIRYKEGERRMSRGNA